MFFVSTAISPSVFFNSIASLAFITVGIALKIALFPLHAWLPNAYAYSPSVGTAFLASTATKVAIYLLLKYLYLVFGYNIIYSNPLFMIVIIALSLAAMFGASIIAIFQSNIKKLFAYSSNFFSEDISILLPLVAICIWFKWTFYSNANIVRLFF